MEQAIAEDKNLFLLEDDAFFEEDFIEIMEKTRDFFEKNDWDMLYLGGYHREGSWSKTENEHVIKVKGSGGWHGVFIKKNIMEFLVKLPPFGPFDWMSSLIIHPTANCYAIYPSVVSQRNAQFSYVENTVLNKPSRYER